MCFVFDRDIFGGFGFALPFGTPDAPGNVAACCATSAELRRGFRVDVPASSGIGVGGAKIRRAEIGKRKQIEIK